MATFYSKSETLKELMAIHARWQTEKDSLERELKAWPLYDPKQATLEPFYQHDDISKLMTAKPPLLYQLLFSTKGPISRFDAEQKSRELNGKKIGFLESLNPIASLKRMMAHKVAWDFDGWDKSKAQAFVSRHEALTQKYFRYHHHIMWGGDLNNLGQCLVRMIDDVKADPNPDICLDADRAVNPKDFFNNLVSDCTLCGGRNFFSAENQGLMRHSVAESLRIAQSFADSSAELAIIEAQLLPIRAMMREIGEFARHNPIVRGSDLRKIYGGHAAAAGFTKQ